MKVLKTVPQSVADSFQEQYMQLPLADCLKLAEKQARACRSQRTPASVVSVCAICRSIWAAYLNEWTTNRLQADEHRLPVEAAMKTCLVAAEDVVPELDGDDLTRGRHYIENIQLRLHWANVLHTKGRAAAEAQMMKRLEEAMACA
jgi:hypothetical protein